MGILADLGLFFIGLGILLGAVGFLWWCSMYEEIKLPKKEKKK